MSAILSADDLNDFISPGVACVKPVETLPLQKPHESNVRLLRDSYGILLISIIQDPYEVTTEDKLPPINHPPASISLTDCLACSGCVTSAEAILVSLQSHSEVLNALDSQPSIEPSQLRRQGADSIDEGFVEGDTREAREARVFVASVSPQVRASLAATYGLSEVEAGWMIDQLLGGPQGLAMGGRHGNRFAWSVDTNAMREACLVLGADEVMDSLQSSDSTIPSSEEGASTTTPRKPILTSACPGWICYAEKTHPHILPHLSRLKSPQALTGTLLKTILSQCLRIRPDQIWHVSIMPCFDKKLEASREELTDIYWRSPSSDSTPPVRDVDCVITARELLMLADTRGISFPNLPRKPLPPSSGIPFPDPTLATFLFPTNHNRPRSRAQPPSAGTSGGYLHHVLQSQLALHPGSTLHTTRGRNADVVEYTLTSPAETKDLFKAARYYGFRNIQNLVRKLKPAKKSRIPGARPGLAGKPTGGGGGAMDYAYVEVMACPGGCTNGGGQVKVDDLGAGQQSQKEFLARVDEAYFSMAEDDEGANNHADHQTEHNDRDGDTQMNDQARDPEKEDGGTERVREMLKYWALSTGIPLQKLAYTSYRKVESDVGKDKGGGADRVVELAGRIGGGW